MSAELFAHLLLTSKQPGTMASEHTVTDKVASGRGSALTGDRQKHCEAKRRFESHLSEGDVAAPCDGMAPAGSQAMRSQRDVKGGTDVLGPDLLDGL